MSEINILTFEPVPKGAISVKGYQKTYRIRIGQYRIIYRINYEQKAIRIETIGKRENVYDRMKF